VKKEAIIVIVVLAIIALSIYALHTYKKYKWLQDNPLGSENNPINDPYTLYDVANPFVKDNGLKLISNTSNLPNGNVPSTNGNVPLYLNPNTPAFKGGINPLDSLNNS